jgi:ABC-type Mn2+/Zn2+ transport system permease subunit
MISYYFYFAMFVITANFSYAFRQFEKGNEDIFSIPLFAVTIAISVIGLVWIQKRLATVQKLKEANQPTQTREN